MGQQPSAPTLPADAAGLRASLLGWYDRHRRALPWRAGPEARADAYAVLVSEMMLQQTTVATVRGRFGPFMERFPSLAALAMAPLDDVLHAWQGLGYYRRARALHACAIAVTERHGGRLPDTLEDLLALPGIGAYTAAAIAAIAFDKGVLPVDGNVKRVLARLVRLDRPMEGADKAFAALAAALASDRRAGDLAQAMMDLGATICTPRNPACALCPWHAACRAAAAGMATDYPVRRARKARPERHATAFLLERADGAILLRRRPPEGLLGGMIELPSGPWHEHGPPAMEDELAAAPARAAWRPVEGEVRHVFTHFALNLRVLRAPGEAGGDGFFFHHPDDLGALALPTLTRKLLRHAGIEA